MSIKLSIIVPVYNVSNYLEECLDSLLKQNIENYEVIMVDDGSTDNSYEIVQEYEQKYDHFIGMTKVNQGLGHSRNVGAAMAKGEYITFADSDDIIPNNSYKEMLDTIEKTGSDFVIGNVIRFNSNGQFESTLHNHVFRENYEKISIRTHKELLYDTTAWNKIYRSSFWKKHDFKFPEGMLYEDIPVTIPSHILADSVDVLTKTTYLWRARDEGDQSITQQRSNINNLSDRLKAIQMVWEFMEKKGTNKDIKDAFDFKNLNMDFQIYINYLKEKKPDFNQLLIKYLQEYLSHVSDDTMLELVVIKRLKYQLIKEGRIDDFIKLVDLETRHDLDMKPYKKGHNFYYHFPFIDCLTSQQQVANNTFDMRTRIEKVSWKTPTNLKIEGFAYIYHLDTSKDISFSFYLNNEKTGYTCELVSHYKPSKRKDVKTMYGGKVKNSKNPLKRLYDYSYSGFSLEIDPAKFDYEKFMDGSNYVSIVIHNQGIHVTKNLRSPIAGFVTRPKYRLKNFIKLSVEYNSFWEFKYQLEEVENIIRAISFVNNQLQITGEHNSNVNEINTSEYFLRTSFYDNPYLTNKMIHSVESNVNNNSFKFLFDKTELDFTSEVESYDLIGQDNYVVDTNILDTIYMFNESKQIKVDYYVKNELKLAITDYRAVLENAYFEEANKVIVKLSMNKADIWNLDSNDVTLKLFDLENSLYTYKPISTSFEKNRVFYEFSISLLTGKKLNLSEKLYRLFLVMPHTNNEKELFDVEVVFPNQGIDRYRYEKLGYRFELRHLRGSSIAVLSQTKHWKKIEDGPRRQAFLRDIFYPIMRKLPLKNIAVYESYWGKEYSCNPQALCEYVQKNDKKIKNIVFLQDAFHEVDGNVTTVKINSLKYYYYLARAKYLVNNVNFPDFYKKRSDAIEIQTMHGTPLKKLGLDSPNEIKRHYVDTYIAKNNRWDYLLIPSDYVGDISKSAFKFNREFIKSGYPRNDKLFADNTRENIERLKEKYNLPSDKKIVLYAPTWRTKGNFTLAMDIEKMSKQLGDDYFILVKLHHFSKANFDLSNYSDFMRDVSMDSDIRELYLVSDMLITDYSSVMFDFALLDKPMIFYVYDYDKYKDELRGFYFDFEKEAPGELAYTTNDLIDILKNMDTYIANNKAKYLAFSDKFNQYDNGNASEIVYKKVMKKK
ncbi:bifunctional glycosyltransferase/CDP-glycerol:glycerophosphate glycerophosphotransferase [Vagococcus sp. JNUCC 83]